MPCFSHRDTLCHISSGITFINVVSYSFVMLGMSGLFGFFEHFHFLCLLLYTIASGLLSAVFLIDYYCINASVLFRHFINECFN
jgi:hypothetical protein